MDANMQFVCPAALGGLDPRTQEEAHILDRRADPQLCEPRFEVSWRQVQASEGTR